MKQSRMVEEQLRAPGRGITNERVLEAMRQVPRHEFVPPACRDQAYDDHPLPIGHEQTISQPFIVAFMTEHLAPQPTNRILEIGTGSGYQAAVLSLLVSQVYSVEIVEALARQASEDLRRLGYDNVHVRFGDGYQGWPEHGPYDAVIVTCAPNHVPQPLVDQLKDGGRLVIPLGGGFSQELYLFDKIDGGLQSRAVLPVRFVPMTGEAMERRV